MKERTFSTTVRVDVRSAAILARFFKENNNPQRNKAELLRAGIELAADIILSNHPSFKVDEIEAVKILQEMEINPLSGRNVKRLSEKLSTQDILEKVAKPDNNIKEVARRISMMLSTPEVRVDVKKELSRIDKVEVVDD